MKDILAISSYLFKLEKSILACYILYILIYGQISWTRSEQTKNSLKAMKHSFTEECQRSIIDNY